MQYVVQTAMVVQNRHGIEKPPTYDVAHKATITCRDKREAIEMASVMEMMPDRKVWPGIRVYTEGGVAVLLSFTDMERIVSEWTQARDIR